MAYTAGFSVNVGDPTKASDVSTLAANDDFLKNAIDTFIANDANNRILTGTGSGTANGEANLTFDGSTLTVTGDLVVDTSVLKVDSSNNRIGVGTTAPSVLFQTAANKNLSSFAGNTQALFENSDTNDVCRVGIIAGTNGFSVLDFGDSALQSAGHITYSHGANSMTLGTTDGGSDVQIDTNGNLLVGYTSSQGSYKLQVNSQIFATSATIATSDQKYKTNISSLENATDLVLKLNPVKFDWIPHQLFNFDTETTQVGFIAQEVKDALSGTAFSDSIIKSNTATQEETTDANGNTIPAFSEEYLGIAEGNLISLLTAALKESIQRIKTLESKIS